MATRGLDCLASTISTDSLLTQRTGSKRCLLLPLIGWLQGMVPNDGMGARSLEALVDLPYFAATCIRAALDVHTSRRTRAATAEHSAVILHR